MEERDGSMERLKYFLLGGIIGALTALLFAPKTGRETREMIAAKAKESREAVEGGIKAAREGLVSAKDKVETEAKEIIDKAKNITVQERDKLSAAIEAGKQAYKSEKEALTKS